MRTIRLARSCLFPLFALACLTACVRSGPQPRTPLPPPPISLVESTSVQFAPIGEHLLAMRSLPDLPRAAIFNQTDCIRGCYSQEQVNEALQTALDALIDAANQLAAIRAQDKAARATNKHSQPAPENQP